MIIINSIKMAIELYIIIIIIVKLHIPDLENSRMPAGSSLLQEFRFY
jgi:hypothetical protein